MSNDTMTDAEVMGMTEAQFAAYLADADRRDVLLDSREGFLQLDAEVDVKVTAARTARETAESIAIHEARKAGLAMWRQSR